MAKGKGNNQSVESDTQMLRYLTPVLRGKHRDDTKLLPKTWNRNQAKEFDQKETTRLFGAAKGTIKQKHPISQAVVLYCQHKCPDLKGGLEIEKELARLFGYYEGKYIEELADVARAYRETEQSRVKPATIKNKLSYLRAACNYAHKFHKFEALPPIELLKVKNERQSLSIGVK